ncbi:uncharacterized protein HMPREF1541_10768 [Cyphellophora europaea CBS 101466]|uniref:Uncharacterized protein n=1 Tax=Cyphellophora europaea (strain CBS 101466) TaxID=1220924 RepID=W2S691_CYPE1|nr:uncharacterized protein HMPREF1541_10768 [Cyphellophora europaea CBS 101466]ETN44217.1 hypothetical protein HMPREF1541_10768 [Cyphellophora europaea CBS 101466]
MHSSEHRLPLAIEKRLSNDLAYIAAAQEGVHSVTAACIEENNGGDDIGTEMTLTLRLAANGGIPETVRSALEEIWRTAQTGAGPGGRSKAVRDSIFAKIVCLNGARILQRIRNALGYPPGFISGRPGFLTASTDRLKRCIQSIRQWRHLTAFGRSFAAELEELEQKFCAICANWTPEDVALSPDDAVVKRLEVVSKQAFQLTTTGQNGGGILFSEVLEQAGLDVRFWLENKSLVEVDKIGAYRRVAKTLVQVYREILNTLAMSNVELKITTLAPYRPVRSKISHKISSRKSQVDCYVHAEIQLLCHYVLEQPADRCFPRVMGTSKLSCFLCFLCISCYGGLEPPLPHGQVFDQWTVPDLVQFDKEVVTRLRQTIDLMNATIVRLAKKKYVPRAFPLTSRVHIDEVPVSSIEGSHSRSSSTTKMSESLRATHVRSSTGGADSEVPDRVTTESRAGSSPAHSVGGTSNSCSNGEYVAVTAAAHHWALSQASNVEILVEAEHPCMGQARLEHLALPDGKLEAVASIVVDELLPGKDYVFLRNIDQPEMVLDFKLPEWSGLHRLKLRWGETRLEDT